MLTDKLLIKSIIFPINMVQFLKAPVRVIYKGDEITSLLSSVSILEEEISSKNF